MKRSILVIVLSFWGYCYIYGQNNVLNRQQFFLDEYPIGVTVTSDLKKLMNERNKPAYQPAHIKMVFSDTVVIEGDIRIMPRGEYRRKYCDLASLMLNFRNPTSPLLSPLQKLKLVSTCKNGKVYNELVLKEFVAYKIYNFITNMSFRVRLLYITFKDSMEKVKDVTNYAFLIEDVKDLADRNNCIEIEDRDFLTAATNREQTSIVNIFQYMIGNTDWSIPNYHNMKLLLPKNDTFAKPYAIAYDFDYAGLVDASYAVPAPELGLHSVTERAYRGFSRSYDELAAALTIFQDKKESIYYFIRHFEYLSDKSKRSMINYLDGFYDIIKNRSSVEHIFIRNARIQ